MFTEKDLDSHQEERLARIRNRICDYEEELPRYVPRVPEIADWYFANLVGGANHEWRSEAPDHYRDQMLMFPERQVGYYRSPYSFMLGGDCYASNEGWLLPDPVKIDQFFEVTAQKYRLEDFIPAEVVALNGEPLVVAAELLAHFPMQEFLRSQICAGFAACKAENDWEEDPYSWLDNPFVPLPRIAETRKDVQTEQTAGCLIHPSGTLVVLRGRSFQHLLYDTAPLSLVAVKRARERAAELTGQLSALAGVSESLACNWAVLSDEDFEGLCYDLIFLHPKYNAETIRKLGKSRSRDGGRDIEVFELSHRPWEKPRKWIFQCKLVKDGSSLGARRVADIGDMLEQYDAQGFGVLTSAPIDATLYDKLDSICRGRGVDQLHMSVYELERALARHPTVKRHFFSKR
jgi:hypothetical protein